MIDMYKTVQNFPTCYNAQNPKFRWQQNDPKLGQDFRVWKQQSANSASESACNSAGGAFRASTGKSDGSGKCYTYMVLKRVCLMMAYKEYPETASYTWEYRGGCYGSGSIAVYERAVLGQEYHFDNIPIEVREDESEYSSSHNAQVDAESTSDSQDSSSSGTASSSYRAQTSSTSTTTTTTTGGGISGFFSTLSTIFLVLAILAGILFAFLFFQTWKAAQAGPAMRHQEQVDED